MKTLTAAQVKSIKEAGLHRAGVGLYSLSRRMMKPFDYWVANSRS